MKAKIGNYTILYEYTNEIGTTDEYGRQEVIKEPIITDILNKRGESVYNSFKEKTIRRIEEKLV